MGVFHVLQIVQMVPNCATHGAQKCPTGKFFVTAKHHAAGKSIYYN